jgi:hypothetical protein
VRAWITVAYPFVCSPPHICVSGSCTGWCEGTQSEKHLNEVQIHGMKDGYECQVEIGELWELAVTGMRDGRETKKK